jgi:hypothetical protein
MAVVKWDAPGLCQWLSGSSTEPVDNPVDKHFDNCVNVAVSLGFLRIDYILLTLEPIDSLAIFLASRDPS